MITLKMLTAAAVLALGLPAMMVSPVSAQSIGAAKESAIRGGGGGRGPGFIPGRVGPGYNGGGGGRGPGFIPGRVGPGYNGGGGGRGPGFIAGRVGPGYNGGGYGRGGGFIPGAVAGAVIGGAIASGGYYGNGNGYYGNGYYGGSPYYGAPYDDGGVVEDAAPVASNGGDDVEYCSQTYRSYDPRSGTYVGYDGARHSCP